AIMITRHTPDQRRLKMRGAKKYAAYGLLIAVGALGLLWFVSLIVWAFTGSHLCNFVSGVFLMACALFSLLYGNRTIWVVLIFIGVLLAGASNVLFQIAPHSPLGMILSLVSGLLAVCFLGFVYWRAVHGKQSFREIGRALRSLGTEL
ncbi:MAG: hypothetical protein V2A74_10055, partial [bacterium]